MTARNEPVDDITHWHAHVYFDAASLDHARALCENAARELPVRMGRIHERPVGPHPQWSCQLEFAPDDFGRIVPWLNMNRDGLTVFVHPNTGDELADHRDRAIWLGDSDQLRLDIFDDPQD